MPHTEALERRFVAKLKALQFEPKIRNALVALTTGSAARILASGRPPLKFIEQVEYNGRRLAKLNLAPSSIVEALQEYDRRLGLLAEAQKRKRAVEALEKELAALQRRMARLSV